MKLLLVLAFVVSTVNAAKLNFDAQPAFANGRIINGENAMKGEAPFIASLQKGYSGHFCAGSIINEHWILTAGHCLFQDSFDVVVGLYNRDDKSDVQVRHVSGKEYQIVHENYTGGVGPFDIGLIHISEAFDLNVMSRDGSAPVGKINLASGKYEQVGKGKLFGWGIDNSGYLPNTLQTLSVNIIGYEECKKALPLYAPLDKTNICTHTPNKPDGSCNGDSGGPLLGYTAGGVEQVGIVSWGYIPCSSSNYPSVYTQVSAHTHWIEDSIDTFNANQLSNE